LNPYRKPSGWKLNEEGCKFESNTKPTAKKKKEGGQKKNVSAIPIQ